MLFFFWITFEILMIIICKTIRTRCFFLITDNYMFSKCILSVSVSHITQITSISMQFDL